MKHLILLFFGIFLGFSAISAPLSASNNATQNLNSVAAIVNNEVITQSDFNKAMVTAKQQLVASQNPNAISNSKLRTMVLNQLIDEKLIMQLAKHANLTVSDAQVTKAITEIATANHLTIAQLKTQLVAHNTNYADYRKLIHKQILVHQIEQSAIADKIHITPQDIKNAQIAYQSQPSGFQSFHVIDILSNTKQAAEAIMVALKKDGHIQNATDLGWQTAATLPTIFIDQIAHMQPGDIAGPIQAPNGFHVIKLIGIRGGTLTTPTQPQLQNLAYQMQSQKAVQKWLKTLRKTAYIQIINP